MKLGFGLVPVVDRPDAIRYRIANNFYPHGRCGGVAAGFEINNIAPAGIPHADIGRVVETALHMLLANGERGAVQCRGTGQFRLRPLYR